jgi:hypothetical protein
LHVVLSDRNADDHFVKFCVEYAIKNADSEGAVLTEILMKMSKTQRLKLPIKVCEYIEKQQTVSRAG